MVRDEQKKNQIEYQTNTEPAVACTIIIFLLLWQKTAETQFPPLLTQKTWLTLKRLEKDTWLALTANIDSPSFMANQTMPNFF